MQLFGFLLITALGFARAAEITLTCDTTVCSADAKVDDTVNFSHTLSHAVVSSDPDWSASNCDTATELCVTNSGASLEIEGKVEADTTRIEFRKGENVAYSYIKKTSGPIVTCPAQCANPQVIEVDDNNKFAATPLVLNFVPLASESNLQKITSTSMGSGACGAGKFCDTLGEADGKKTITVSGAAGVDAVKATFTYTPAGGAKIVNTVFFSKAIADVECDKPDVTCTTPTFVTIDATGNVVAGANVLTLSAVPAAIADIAFVITRDVVSNQKLIISTNECAPTSDVCLRSKAGKDVKLEGKLTKLPIEYKIKLEDDSTFTFIFRFNTGVFVKTSVAALTVFILSAIFN